MKKSIVIAVLGMTAAMANSYGQGYILFQNYTVNSGAGSTVALFSNPSTFLGSTFTATLYYALGTVVDNVNQGSAASITSPVTGLNLLGGVSASFASALVNNTAGYFDFGAVVTIPDYVSGPISFEIVASNGVDILGRSGAFTMASINTSTLAPATTLQGVPNFLVAPVPEPATLALAGLGGLASLVMLRRKKA